MRRFIPVCALFSCLLFTQSAHAAYMSPVSDLIVNSQPSTSTAHIITFTVTNAIPANGTVTITPEDAFSIPGGLSVNDVDFAVASGGPYSERDLAASPTAAFDGVSVVSGSSGSVTITLNSTTGVSAGDQLRVVLGSAATHQTTGSISPVNPATPGGYRVRVNTAQGGGGSIDDAKAMVFIVLPVSVTTTINENAPVVSNALPSGTIPAGSDFVEISFETDVIATCKFATSTGIAYTSMPNTASNIAGRVHYSVVSGHTNGNTYHYYIRCRDSFGATASADYDLSFALASTPTVTSSDGTTPGQQTSGTPGAGGSGGAGAFPGGSSLLFQSNVIVSGRGPANGSVSILKDGKLQLATQAKSDGSFSATITGLERGTYTFVAFSTDAKSRTSSRFSSTLTLNSGTNNTISGVLLSPTVAPDSEIVDVGDSARISGIGVPDTLVQIALREVPTTGQPGPAKIFTASTSPENSAGTGGSWEFTIPARDLKRGTVDIRVKTNTSSASSEFSPPTYVGVGEAPSQRADTGSRSDINGDGKVNLVDFSILLTHWNDADPDADINEDDIVNLSDFSILLFNWTG